MNPEAIDPAFALVVGLVLTAVYVWLRVTESRRGL